MIRQAVQTLTGRGGSEENPAPESVYLLDETPQEPQTEPDEDGTTNTQIDLNALQATVDRLSHQFETRISDKDRHIGRLERQVQNYEEGQYGPPADRQPPVEPEPVLDNDTASLFADKYKEEPEQALIALAEHLDNRSQSRVDENQRQRDQVQQATAALNVMEQNILRNVDLAIRELGPGAAEIVNDFASIVRRGNGTSTDYANTWLGAQLQADRSLGSSPQGVYRLIELETYKRQGNTTETEQPAYEPRPEPQQGAGIMRPTAPSRSVTDLSNSSENEVPIEDRIGNAIVDAARGDDAAMEQIFRG